MAHASSLAPTTRWVPDTGSARERGAGGNGSVGMGRGIECEYRPRIGAASGKKQLRNRPLALGHSREAYEGIVGEIKS